MDIILHLTNMNLVIQTGLNNGYVQIYMKIELETYGLEHSQGLDKLNLKQKNLVTHYKPHPAGYRNEWGKSCIFNL